MIAARTVLPLFAVIALSLATFSPVEAQRAPSLAPSTIDASGVVRFQYPSREIPAIVCAPKIECIIELQVGEEIQDIGSGDSVKRSPDGWIIAQGHQGSTPVIYALPQSDHNVSNLIVTTSRRVYALYLVAAPSSTHWHYGFRYEKQSNDVGLSDGAAGNPNLPPWGKIGPKATPTPTPTPDPTPTVAANFFVTGSAPFRPVNAYSQDGVTYIQLPFGDYSWPGVKRIIYADSTNPQLSPVASTADPTNNRIIVQGTFDVLILWSNETGSEDDVYVSYGRPYNPPAHHHWFF